MIKETGIILKEVLEMDLMKSCHLYLKKPFDLKNWI